MYIDARKEYQVFKEDLLDWLPRVRKGGLMAGHDYCSGTESGPTKGGRRGQFVVGVERAVNELAAALGREVFVMDADHKVRCFRSWYFVA